MDHVVFRTDLNFDHGALLRALQGKYRDVSFYIERAPGYTLEFAERPSPYAPRLLDIARTIEKHLLTVLSEEERERYEAIMNRGDGERRGKL